MESSANPRTEAAVAPRFGIGRIWNLALVALILGQGWITLTLFGPHQPWQQLFSDQPIVSGRHPLHLYHGYLGAQSFLERGTLSCYDPAFQAGYPKTPIFDSGSRPAELFLCFAGGSFSPRAYKLGVALCCLLVPVCLWRAACGSGLGPGSACLATALGLLVWWGGPCRQWLEAGDLDLLLGSLAALAEVGLLLQFHRAPGLVPWLGLLISGAFCWFAQPPLAMLLLALVLVYYLSVGTKHALAWHLSLFGSLAGGMTVHAFWLVDWFDYWSIRCPLCLEVPLLPHRTLHTIWDAPIWGSGPDRLLTIVLIALAIPGVAVWNQTKERPAARLFGLGMSGFLILAITGIAWEPMGILGTPRLLIPALLFAVVPATHALAQGVQCAVQLTSRPGFVAVVAVGVVIVAILAGGRVALALGSRFLTTAPFLIGLTTAEQSIVDMIITQTDREARILWEDRPTAESGSGWTALLPVLTERSFVGGLDTGACIEHGYPSLLSQNLAGRSLDHWSDVELKDFCRHYNIGWVLCRSRGTSARFRAWKEAEPTASSADAPGAFLFRLPSGSVALRGQARLISADWRHIILADVIPEDGKVVLSLHYQAGLRVSPSRVRIEKEPDPRDPIPLVRLRVPDPVARLTLTWQPR